MNCRLQTSLVLLLSCFLLEVIKGQDEQDLDLPIVEDPFPDSDVIGPEPEPTPPPTPDCTSACQERIDEAMAQINYLQQQLMDTNSTLLTRIINLESSGGGGGGDGDLLQRVTNLEYYLPGNVSILMDKINTDVGLLRTQLTDDISLARQELNARIDSIPQGGGGGGGGDAMVSELYANLTQQIRMLEDGKIQRLVNDNNLWRQNFRIVNATFAKLKKSTRGNNVILTG